MATFAATFVPGKYFVEVLPILRFIPWWVPGAQFKKDGKAWKPRVQKLTDTPWDACIAALVSRTSSTVLRLLTVIQKDGSAPPSIVAGLMESASHLDEPARSGDIEIAKATSAAAYAGT